MLDTRYKFIELDTILETQNETMVFSLSDVETSDFYLKVKRNGIEFDLSPYKITLWICKPNKLIKSKVLKYNSELNCIYCNLENELKNVEGQYISQLVIENPTTKEIKFTRSRFNYIVESDILSEIDESVIEENENILSDILKRLSKLESDSSEVVEGKDGRGIVSILKTDTTELIDTYTITYSDNTTSKFQIKNGEVGPQGEKGDTGEQGVKGDKGDTGASGTSVTVKSVSESTADGGNNVVTFSDGKTITIKNGSKGSKGDKGDTGADGQDGLNGKDGTNGVDGKDYILTDIDKSEIAGLVENATIVQAPQYAESVDKMTDTSVPYVLSSTGHIYAYMNTTTEKEVTVTDKIEGTTDNPYQVGRFSSSGTVSTDVTGYVISPYIDLTKSEYKGKTIQLHLEGLQYFGNDILYTQTSIYDSTKTTINGRGYSSTTVNGVWSAIANAEIVVNNDTSTTITMTLPITYGSAKKEISYLRMSAKGTEADSNIYITYPTTQTVTGGQWVDTGTTYAPSITDSDKNELVNEVASLVDAELLNVIGTGVVSV